MKRGALLAVAVVVCLAGCGHVTTLQSRKPRATPTAQAEARVKDVVAGNTAFAVDLYHQLPREGNLVFSPYALSLSLAMTSAGARGETQRQLAHALHFTLPQEQLHAAFNALDGQLSAIGEGGPTLKVATSLWMQDGFPVRPEFLDLLAVNYGAGMQTVDFARDSPGAIRAVNGWVEDRTEGHIEDLLPDADMAQTRLVLADAVYLKAEWEQEFHAANTQPKPFTLLDGQRVTVEMMSGSEAPGEALNYAQGPGYQALELCYKGGRLSMVFLLPAPGQFRAFERNLRPEALAKLWPDLAASEEHYASVEMALPKFTFDSGAGVKQALSALGMAGAFAAGADFGGMSAEQLFLDEVWQKGWIAVHEKGTEAAAAAAVVAAGAAPPAGERLVIARFIADRPFLFLLRDRKTGCVLFLGRVLDPRQ